MIRVAKIALLTKNNEVLALERSKTHPKYPLHLDFPGGEVEAGEDIQSAIVREVNEETGLSIERDDIKVARFLAFSENFQFTLCYLYVKDKPPITLSWEHSSFEWTSATALSEAAKASGIDPYFKFAVKEIAKLL